MNRPKKKTCVECPSCGETIPVRPGPMFYGIQCDCGKWVTITSQVKDHTKGKHEEGKLTIKYNCPVCGSKEWKTPKPIKSEEVTPTKTND